MHVEKWVLEDEVWEDPKVIKYAYLIQGKFCPEWEYHVGLKHELADKQDFRKINGVSL